MINHTPAPWSRNSDDDIHDANGDVVCGANGPTAEEQEANARLIAAAPEMLEALREIAKLASGISRRADARRIGCEAGRVIRLVEGR